MSIQKTGRVTVSADGEQYQSKPGASMQMGGVTRVVEMSDQGVPFHTETIIPGEATFTLIHMADTDMEKIQALKSVEVQYATDTGVVYSSTGTFTKFGDLKNGEVDVSFGGAQFKKV